MHATHLSPLLTLLSLSCFPPVLSAQQGPQPYGLDAGASHVYVVTHRTGLLSFLGHEHAILVSDWTGGVCWSPDTPIGGRGWIRADARTLTIDSDSGRALAGLGSGPSPGQVRSIQRKMLDADHLDVVGYPEISLDSLAVVRSEGDRLEARGVLQLHGVSRPVEVSLRAAPAEAAAFRLTGVLTISQRAFGIEPESIAGVVKASDKVDIHFDLLATRAAGECR